ncbi:ricin-type beta-trefoil lectin domain protein [Streptomyces sp. NBC_01497]|uniref:ricin-type beta-trefoil lectin domain protein n=1 Tax=Streptomyces sp. NBC_01497 TaxID=2903885 RepID=UPI003FCE69D7
MTSPSNTVSPQPSDSGTPSPHPLSPQTPLNRTKALPTAPVEHANAPQASSHTQAAAPPPPTTPQPSSVAILGYGSGRCIAPPAGSAANGTGLDIWDCQDAPQQHWQFQADLTVRVMGKCMDVAGHSGISGAAIVLATCDGSPSQKFDLNKSLDLVNVVADECVDVHGGATKSGSPLDLWPCNGHSNQKWRTEGFAHN